MYTEFHLNAGSLNENFIMGIRTLYKNKSISIFVEEDLDETEYLLRSPANRKMLERSLKSIEKGNLIEVDIDKHLKKKK